MARRIAPDDEGFVYRAVVEYQFDDSDDAEVRTMTFGPYTNAGTARSQVTRETTGRWAQWRKNAKGRIQRAAIEWEDVK